MIASKKSFVTEENPLKGSFKLSDETVKELMKDDNVRKIVTHPEDYKSLVEENILDQSERSAAATTDQKLQHQEELLNANARFVNLLHVNQFLFKLKNAGVRYMLNRLPEFKDRVGVFAEVPGHEMYPFQPSPVPVGYEYIGFLQVPYMPEWDLLKIDERGRPIGTEWRGWRTAVSLLIMQGVMTEKYAHEVFGEPAIGTASRGYRERLYFYRNNHEGHKTK